MNVTGYRYQLQKETRGRWATVVSTDDLALLRKMIGDQDRHATRASSWRLYDRALDKVIQEVTARH